MNKKINNKGFSLVELIVVMAIMAILAVTITPRLTQYIDKARQTNDREIPNAVFTASRLALLDSNVQAEIVAAAVTTEPGYDVDLDWTQGVDLLETYYTRGADGDLDVYSRSATVLDLLANEIAQTLGNSFAFQSNLADSHAAHIIVTVTDIPNGVFSVEFNYEGTVTGQYTMDVAAIGVD